MAYVVREADPRKEWPSIHALRVRNAQVYAEQRHIWMYEANPYGPTRAWVATTSDGEVIGVAGLTPRIVRIGRREVPAGQAIDLIVDARHRTLGPALQLQKAVTTSLQSLGLPLIYAFPNSQSEGLFLRAGYQPIAPLQYWVKPLRSEYKLRQYISSKVALNTIAFLIDIGLRLTERNRSFCIPPGTRAVLLDTFDQRFDDLWDRAALHFPIIGLRSSSYLRWRFGTYPDGRYNIFGLLTADDRLHAFLVFHLSGGKAFIADMLATGPTLLRAVLIEFSRRLRSEGVQAITLACHGPAWVAQTLRGVGFHYRGDVGRVLLYSDPASPPQPDLLDSWYLTEADRDV